MPKIIVIAGALAFIAGAASAHHGWGSYDAAKPVTVSGPILQVTNEVSSQRIR